MYGDAKKSGAMTISILQMYINFFVPRNLGKIRNKSKYHSEYEFYRDDYKMLLYKDWGMELMLFAWHIIIFLYMY